MNGVDQHGLSYEEVSDCAEARPVVLEFGAPEQYRKSGGGRCETKGRVRKGGGSGRGERERQREREEAGERERERQAEREREND